MSQNAKKDDPKQRPHQFWASDHRKKTLISKRHSKKDLQANVTTDNTAPCAVYTRNSRETVLCPSKFLSRSNTPVIFLVFPVCLFFLLSVLGAAQLNQ